MQRRYELSPSMQRFFEKKPASGRRLGNYTTQSGFTEFSGDRATLKYLRSEIFIDDPLHYYRLGDNLTTIATDEVNPPANGTYIGGFTQAVAPGGYLETDHAVALDGVTGEVEIPVAFSSAVAANEWTIEGLFYWVSGSVLMRDHTTGGAGWILAFDSNGSVGFRVDGNDFITSQAVQPLQNSWHHFVLCGDAGVVRLYIDSIMVHEANLPSIGESVAPFHVGRNGTGPAYSAIRADELAFYATALSADRVASHFNAFAGIPDEESA